MSVLRGVLAHGRYDDTIPKRHPAKRGSLEQMHASILPQIRRAESGDEPALWEMLTFAASMTEVDPVPVAQAT